MMNERLAETELKHSMAHTDFIIRQIAAMKITAAWKRYRMTRIFRHYKTQLLSSEQFLTTEVLKRVSPREAELLRDPVMGGRVRFRFGGESFPPSIYYKIFTTAKSRVIYFCGREIISPSSKAAEDTLKIKGAKSYAQDVIMDIQDVVRYHVSSIHDVTNQFEFIQHSNFVDERPAYVGGKNNGWRELRVAFLAQPVTYQLHSLARSNNNMKSLKTFPVSRHGHFKKRPVNESRLDKRLRELKKRMALYQTPDERLSSDLFGSDSLKTSDILKMGEGETKEDGEFMKLFAWSSDLGDVEVDSSSV